MPRLYQVPVPRGLPIPKRSSERIAFLEGLLERNNAQEISEEFRKLGTRAERFEAATIARAKANDVYLREFVEKSEILAGQWATGHRNIMRIIVKHKDDLDTIGPSIGNYIINGTVMETAGFYFAASVFEGDIFKQLSVIHREEEEIGKLYAKYVRCAVLAKMNQEKANDGSPVLPTELQERLERNVVHEVCEIEAGILYHKYLTKRHAIGHKLPLPKR